LTDHNVSLRLAERPRGRGFAVTTARALGLERTKDSKLLLAAADRGLLRLTRHERDFDLLFDAWRRWFAAWGLSPRHAGIVVLPQRAPPVTEVLFLPLVGEAPDFAGSLSRRQPSTGWSRLAYVP